MKLPSELPSLHHEEVTLRTPRPDLSLLQDAAADPYLRLLYGIPERPDAAFAALRADRQRARIAFGLGASFDITEALTDRGVGGIGLWLRAKAPEGTTGYTEEAHGRASISYWVAPTHRRKGYATQALLAISAWAFALDDVQRLELYIEPWNEGSWRAAERGGYEREGLLRSWQLIGDARRDMYVYSRLAASR